MRFRLAAGNSVLVVAMVAMALAACTSRDEPPEILEWAGEGVAFRYPDTLEPHPVSFAAGAPAKDCICNAAMAAAAPMWTELESGTLALDGGEDEGVGFRVLDVSSDSALAGELAAPSDTAVKEVAGRLSVPANPEDDHGYTIARESLDGLPAARFTASGLEVEGGETVTRLDWLVFDSRLDRVYTITCQHSGDDSAAARACDTVIGSFRTL